MEDEVVKSKPVELVFKTPYKFNEREIWEPVPEVNWDIPTPPVPCERCNEKRGLKRCDCTFEGELKDFYVLKE